MSGGKNSRGAFRNNPHFSQFVFTCLICQINENTADQQNIADFLLNGKLPRHKRGGRIIAGSDFAT